MKKVGEGASLGSGFINLEHTRALGLYSLYLSMLNLIIPEK